MTAASEPLPTAEAADAAALAERVVSNLGSAIHASPETLRLPFLCLLAEGHVLVEDVPGVGKTVLAKALARSLELTFHRVQFTPDLLPADVTGVNVFDRQSGAFRFRAGPVFANVLLVDEINRASPKTQSALLEAMQETQVTVDGTTHVLERPFLVIATQNPVEYEGTFPLPEAQLDRFAVRMTIGYPPHADEARMLAEQTTSPPLDHLRAGRRARRAPRRDRRCAAGPRRGERHALRRRAPAPHARELASRARRQPALRDRAPLARQGAGARRGSRVRRPGGRPGARRDRPCPPADPGSGGAGHGRHRGGDRRGRPRRDRGARVTRRPRTTGVRADSGAGLLALAVLAAAWVVGSTALAVLGIGLGRRRPRGARSGRSSRRGCSPSSGFPRACRPSRAGSSGSESRCAARRGSARGSSCARPSARSGSSRSRSSAAAGRSWSSTTFHAGGTGSVRGGSSPVTRSGSRPSSGTFPPARPCSSGHASPR